MAELDATLQRKFTISQSVKVFLSAYQKSVMLVEPATLPTPVCRDVDDDTVLATAVAARATVIVSGDHDLLVLKAYDGIPIITPRAFVEFLDRSVSR